MAPTPTSSQQNDPLKKLASNGNYIMGSQRSMKSELLPSTG